MGAVLTIDLEDFNHALHIHNEGHSSIPLVRNYLLPILKKYKVKGLFYILGRVMIEDSHSDPVIHIAIHKEGHELGWHGEYHDWGEENPNKTFGENFRSPYWSKTKMPWPPSGGFFFRFMPYWYVKWAVKKSGVFWIHPHDLDEDHPQLKNPFLNWKRHVGLKESKKKLERLLQEVQFDDPRTLS